MYITRHNPHALTERRTLGAVGAFAPSNPLESMANALQTPTSSLLILLGGGLALGWLANDLYTGTRKAVRRARTATRKRKAAAQATWDQHSDKLVPMLLVALIAIGGTYYFTTRRGVPNA